MLTDNHICEGLSRAYVQAVAARAGCNCSVRAHDYGIDGTFLQVTSIGEELVEEGATINFQLKSSSSANLVKVRDEVVTYKLEARAHRVLAGPHPIPRILILLVLPEDPTEWLSADESALQLRRCAYWLSLRAQTPTANAETITVPIPRVQRFDVEALTAMLDRVKSGGFP